MIGRIFVPVNEIAIADERIRRRNAAEFRWDI
jgi:hypothetical protein